MRNIQNYRTPVTVIFLIIILAGSSSAQIYLSGSIENRNYNESAHTIKGSIQKDTIEYAEVKKKITAEFNNQDPGQFGEFIKGVKVKIDTKSKLIAFTFDACGGRGGNGYNAALTGYLRKEKIPATLFVTGSWIDANKKTFSELAADTLFEIENHGLKHRLCSVNGESVYGIKGTKNAGEVVDEMELNARKIQRLTGTRPIFFRSATAFTDEVCVKIAAELNMQIVSYSVLSGDAIANTPAIKLADNIIKHVKEGSIVIMHFNHPSWNEKDALEIVIPKLREKGFQFVKLKDNNLTGN